MNFAFSEEQDQLRDAVRRFLEAKSASSDAASVKRFLGEGGKKRVYLAHDSLLDRDIAFALIKTEGLDAASRTRITRGMCT